MDEVKEPQPERQPEPEREWTVMFYLASDNPLAPSTIMQLKAIKNAGYHQEVNVLAQFDPHTANMPVHIFDVNRLEKLKHPNRPNIGFASNDPFVRNLVTDKLWPDKIKKKIQVALKKEKLNIPFDPPVPLDKKDRQELAPKQSLEEFLQFCRKNYPARHYMLFIVGHGVIVGNDLFLHDAHVGTTRQGNLRPTSLSLIDLACILGRFNDSLGEGQQLEMIGFHACSMSGVEVAFQLKDKANFMLASQGPTYVGSYPYRQILIRLFSDLHSGKDFIQEEVGADGLIDVLKLGTDPFAQFFLKRLNGNGTRELLDKHLNGNKPAQELVGAVTNELNGWLIDQKLSDGFSQTELPAMRKELLATIAVGKLEGKHSRRVNRRLILDALPPEVAREMRIKRLCKKIFDYCLFNSFDFQLAGYSCDLTLCDLTKIDHLKVPITNLVQSLIDGLKHSRKDPLVRELMILAHWEAQSFYQEQYTDIYDYCFRLRTKCKAELDKNPSDKTQAVLKNLADACEEVMKVLKRGKHNEDDGVIVRSEFSGPDYQYTHGLSVFFPWSEPVDNKMWKKLYGQFAFNETDWQKFLKQYFKATKRKPEGDEVNDVEPARREEALLDEDLLELLRMMALQVYNDDGQLGSVGSRDPMGTVGSRDPQGGDCDCASIKNYPAITRSTSKSLKGTNKQLISELRHQSTDYSRRRRRQ